MKKREEVNAAIPLDFGLLFEGGRADLVFCIGVEFSCFHRQASFVGLDRAVNGGDQWAVSSLTSAHSLCRAHTHTLFC